EPVLDPGGEAQARAARRGLLRLPRRPRERRPDGARVRRAARAPKPRLDRRLHGCEPRDHAAGGGLSTGAPAGRCYTRRAPGSVSKTAAHGAFSMKNRASLALISLLFALLVTACGGGGGKASLGGGDVLVVGGQRV